MSFEVRAFGIVYLKSRAWRKIGLEFMGVMFWMR